jgi:hypothetical protein
MLGAGQHLGPQAGDERAELDLRPATGDCGVENVTDQRGHPVKEIRRLGRQVHALPGAHDYFLP